MGEVYRARDTKLGREVALKVLPEAVSGSAERRARFEREAKLLATLNHPLIAALYEVHEHADGDVLVMEMVEGETLADRLSRGALPMKRALEVGQRVAEALEGAHERGILHRDLKPANIRVPRFQAGRGTAHAGGAGGRRPWSIGLFSPLTTSTTSCRFARSSPAGRGRERDTAPLTTGPHARRGPDSGLIGQ